MRPLALALILVACATAAKPAPAPASAPATSAPTAAPAILSKTVAFYRIEATEWFTTRVPADWYVEGPRLLEGSVLIREHLTLSNRSLLPWRAALNSGAYEWASVPKDTVALRAETTCRQTCSGARTESAFPLDLYRADTYSFSFNPAVQAGFDVRIIPLRFVDERLNLWLYLGGEAPVRDEDRLAGVVAAIAPTGSPPVRGEFRGWTALGPAAERRAGGFWTERTASGTAFYLLRDGDDFLAFPTTYERWTPRPNCPLRWDGDYFFVCEATGDRWTRTGRYTGSAPASDLPRLRVVVRDGVVLVR